METQYLRNCLPLLQNKPLNVRKLHRRSNQLRRETQHNARRVKSSSQAGWIKNEPEQGNSDTSERGTDKARQYNSRKPRKLHIPGTQTQIKQR